MTFQIRGNLLRERGLTGFRPSPPPEHRAPQLPPLTPPGHTEPRVFKTERPPSCSKTRGNTVLDAAGTLGVPESEELCHGDWSGLPCPTFLQTREVFHARAPSKPLAERAHASAAEPWGAGYGGGRVTFLKPHPYSLQMFFPHRVEGSEKPAHWPFPYLGLAALPTGSHRWKPHRNRNSC